MLRTSIRRLGNKPISNFPSILTTQSRTNTTSSSEQTTSSNGEKTKASEPAQEPQQQTPKRKTQAQLDEELRAKMSGIAGDGGEAGIEYEDGVPVAMKRSVKNNMFRYI